MLQGDSRGGADGGGGDGGIGAIDKDQDAGGGAAEQIACVVGGDANAYAGAAAANGFVKLVGGLDRAGEGEDIGGGEALQQIAALLGLRLIEDNGGDLADVGVDGEAEEEELQHGDEQREEERAAVAGNVNGFFAANGNQAVEEMLHGCFSMMR